VAGHCFTTYHAERRDPIDPRLDSHAKGLRRQSCCSFEIRSSKRIANVQNVVVHRPAGIVRMGWEADILAMALISGQGPPSALPCAHDICFSRSFWRRVGSPVLTGPARGALAQHERLRTDFHLLHRVEVIKPKLDLRGPAPAFPRSIYNGAFFDAGGEFPRLLYRANNRGSRDPARSGTPRSSRHSFMRCALKRNVRDWVVSRTAASGDRSSDLERRECRGELPFDLSCGSAILALSGKSEPTRQQIPLDRLQK
jgi:hypothetical protein